MRNRLTHSKNWQTTQTASARPHIEIDGSVGTIRVSDSRPITKSPVFSSLSIYGLSRLPGIPDEAAADIPPRQSPQQALPAP